MKIVFILAFICFFSLCLQAQTKPVVKPTPNVNTQSAKYSFAYAEVLLQKTELTAELEELLLNYTEEYPKVKELRFELSVLQKDLDKLLTVSEASRLSQALGKLIVRRARLATDLWNLQKQYANDHPDVKKAKRKLEIFEQAIKEILP